MHTIIKFKKLAPAAIIPKYSSDEAAGADIHACQGEKIVINPHETVLIHTQIALEMPKGIVGLVFARSGLATKKGIAPANKVGVIDSDYRGEIMVPLHNHSNEVVSFDDGDRIAQIIFMPYLTASFEETDILNETKRADGGFGSTGVSK